MKLSEMTKEELKNSPYFFLINPNKLETIDEYAQWLESMLHSACSVWDEDGDEFIIETKELIARVEGLKIEIYSNEHPPPHFHVKSPNVNASFNIENCQLLKGEIKNKDKRKIIFWHKHAKPLLIEAWNRNRPTDCTVGMYTGT